MSGLRKFIISGALALGVASLAAGPAFAFGAGGHGGGGGGGIGGGGGHVGGFGSSHAGGFDGGHVAGRIGGDRVFTGRSVGIDRGGYGRGFYRGGRWFAYDCSPIGIDEGLCPADYDGGY